MRTRLLLGLVMLLGAALCQAQPLAVANGGLTGQWFNLDRSGEGFFIEVVDVSGTPNLAISWFTYDGSGNQMWLVGSTPIDADSTRVQLPVFVTNGPVFGPGFDPDDVQLTEWGTLAFEFSDCDAGTVTYDSSLGFGNGMIELVRLTSILDFDCARPPEPADVFPGRWVVRDIPTVCFNVSPDGQRITRTGSGCGRVAPLGNALAVVDSFVSNGIECDVSFFSNDTIEILDNQIAIFAGNARLPLVEVIFVQDTRAQLTYNDGVGCQKTYALSPFQ